MFCSAMFAGGNVFYALLGLLPRGEVKIRVWMMLVSRFIVGSGTGEIKLRNMTESLQHDLFSDQRSQQVLRECGHSPV